MSFGKQLVSLATHVGLSLQNVGGYPRSDPILPRPKHLCETKRPALSNLDKGHQVDLHFWRLA